MIASDRVVVRDGAAVRDDRVERRTLDRAPLRAEPLRRAEELAFPRTMRRGRDRSEQAFTKQKAAAVARGGRLQIRFIVQRGCPSLAGLAATYSSKP